MSYQLFATMHTYKSTRQKSQVFSRYHSLSETPVLIDAALTCSNADAHVATNCNRDRVLRCRINFILFEAARHGEPREKIFAAQYSIYLWHSCTRPISMYGKNKRASGGQTAIISVSASIKYVFAQRCTAKFPGRKAMFCDDTIMTREKGGSAKVWRINFALNYSTVNDHARERCET